MSRDDDLERLVDRLRRDRDAKQRAQTAADRAEARLRRQAGIVARHQALSDEHMRNLTDERRAELKRQAMVLFEARTIVQHLYSPWLDDRGLADALAVIEHWLGESARTGDGSGMPPELEFR